MCCVVQPLSSQLHQILQYLSEDSYRKKRDEKMNLSINLFFMEHELSSLCKDVRMFVELCCSNILKPPKTIKVRKICVRMWVSSCCYSLFIY